MAHRRPICSAALGAFLACRGLTFLAPWQSRIERRPEADRLLNATCHLLQEFEISTLLSITYSIHSIKCFCNTPCFATVGCFTAALWLDFHNFVRKYQVRCDLPGTARVAKRGGHAPSCGAPQLTLDSTCQGPLATLHGSKEYLEAMQQWQELLPERLEDFKVKEMEAWQLEPGLITARWRVAFVAPLPPSPKLLELPEDVPKVPGAAVRVETTLRAELTLDAEGKVLRHEEAIAAGFGVLDAVARYELLTARRREVGPVSWYWRVLKETSLEEMAFYTNNQATTEELEWRFNEMVARNFLYGAVLGVLFWITLKITIAARMANLLEERAGGAL
ncbi:unnamed protein product [Durusdinium trenchii]|uniref:Transmembrane 9 superfamily member n=2 Tax=Durusdinium trenchii TaxID=1381693 RepID=A0ABP0N761_9DINO